MIPKTTNVVPAGGEVSEAKDSSCRFWLLLVLFACSLAVYLIDLVALRSYLEVDASFKLFVSHAYGVTVLYSFYLAFVVMTAGYRVALPIRLCTSSNVIIVLLAAVRIALIEIPSGEPETFQRVITALCGVQIIVSVAWMIMEVLRGGPDKKNKS